MEAYIKLSTMTYPLFIGDIHLEYPEWSESQEIPDGWARISYEQMPTVEEYYMVDLLAAELQEDSTWIVRWSDPRPMTEEEKSVYDLNKVKMQEEAEKYQSIVPNTFLHQP